MGSVKDLIIEGSGAELYRRPKSEEFGRGAWNVKGTYSVRDLKHLIPESDIPNKADALTMITANFFEWLSGVHPEIPTCYLGVLDKDNNLVDVDTLLQRGETTHRIVMKLAHVPDTFCSGNLNVYRISLQTGELQCGVADVESIFRKGFPLGSSKFKDIFGSVGRKTQYQTLAKYAETAAALDEIRAEVQAKGLSAFPKLEKILQESGLGTTIPHPGFVLEKMTYDSTTKFEEAGDRVIGKDEEQRLSGLDSEGYRIWTNQMFPTLALAQIEYCQRRGVLNMDGKMECVTYRKKPILTDFACTPDENRLMIVSNVGGVNWAIPSNKEIQRAIFTEAGVDVAITQAKENAKAAGDESTWKNYVPKALQDHNIDLRAVSDYSCNLMAYAISEVGNRLLGRKVFDAKPLDSWVGGFLPYASRVNI